MGLLERAAIEAAKKVSETEEANTDVRGVVKASKIFPIISIVSLLAGGFFLFFKLKVKQDSDSFLLYVLAAAFVVTAVLLLIYAHHFRIEYDRTGFTVRNFFGKEKKYALDDVQKIILKEDGFSVVTTQGKVRVEKDFFLGSMEFMQYLRDYLKEKQE